MYIIKLYFIVKNDILNNQNIQWTTDEKEINFIYINTIITYII